MRRDHEAEKLALMGEYEEPGETEYKIQVTVNSEDKTITVEDNGIGMTPRKWKSTLTRSHFRCTGFPGKI